MSRPNDEVVGVQAQGRWMDEDLMALFGSATLEGSARTAGQFSYVCRQAPPDVTELELISGLQSAIASIVFNRLIELNRPKSDAERVCEALHRMMLSTIEQYDNIKLHALKSGGKA